MADEANQFGRWQPWGPHEVAQLFAAVTVPWWIAGGWALDLFVGEQTREHDDIDVQFLRRDQQAVRSIFGDWDMQEAHPGSSLTWPFRTWELTRPLPREVHDIWCRPTPTAPWALQLMVADSATGRWLFRRDERIHRPLTIIGCRSADGFPYIAPEIQLLYKAKALRSKDEADFDRVLPYLDTARRHWLQQALQMVQPGHPWLGRLEAGM
ncbi:nucleotidyltransferase domain-containing protein [Dictyobacter formicarum]|uniref:Amino acid transporter n=1 Tax=Dictyobacter formicarum TaxID=2778368 RepID=A0ABQ3VMD7_9CHLR|nr:aminoglycoside adenylyltransferase [Dictyobacter formicarum]GHO87374.1 hypothetical protein KSZ_53800 [Dictyobacter formicarum]